MDSFEAFTESELLHRAAAAVDPPRLLVYNPYGGHYVRPADNHPVTGSANYNADDRFELFLLDDGQSKVEHKEETRVPNTAIFTFNKEDHTLGNLLSQRLLKYDYIVFAAYKVPHPLFATFELRVSTDGTITPKDAIIKCCRDVVQDLEQLKQSFTTEWVGKKIVTEGEVERQAREQNNF